MSKFAYSFITGELTSKKEFEALMGTNGTISKSKELGWIHISPDQEIVSYLGANGPIHVRINNLHSQSGGSNSPISQTESEPLPILFPIRNDQRPRLPTSSPSATPAARTQGETPGQPNQIRVPSAPPAPPGLGGEDPPAPMPSAPPAPSSPSEPVPSSPPAPPGLGGEDPPAPSSPSEPIPSAPPAPPGLGGEDPPAPPAPPGLGGEDPPSLIPSAPPAPSSPSAPPDPPSSPSNLGGEEGEPGDVPVADPDDVPMAAQATIQEPTPVPTPPTFQPEPSLMMPSSGSSNNAVLLDLLTKALEVEKEAARVNKERQTSLNKQSKQLQDMLNKVIGYLESAINEDGGNADDDLSDVTNNMIGNSFQVGTATQNNNPVMYVRLRFPQPTTSVPSISNQNPELRKSIIRTNQRTGFLAPELKRVADQRRAEREYRSVSQRRAEDAGTSLRATPDALQQEIHARRERLVRESAEPTPSNESMNSTRRQRVTSVNNTRRQSNPPVRQREAPNWIMKQDPVVEKMLQRQNAVGKRKRRRVMVGGQKGK